MKEIGKLKEVPWGKSLIIAIIGVVAWIGIFIIIRSNASDRLADQLFGYTYVIGGIGFLIGWIKPGTLFC